MITTDCPALAEIGRNGQCRPITLPNGETRCSYCRATMSTPHVLTASAEPIAGIEIPQTPSDALAAVLHYARQFLEDWGSDEGMDAESRENYRQSQAQFDVAEAMLEEIVNPPAKPVPTVSAAPAKVYLVSGQHHVVPGIRSSLHSTMEAADAQAWELLKMQAEYADGFSLHTRGADGVSWRSELQRLQEWVDSEIQPDIEIVELEIDKP